MPKFKVAISMVFNGEVDVEAETPEAAIEHCIVLKENALPTETPVNLDYFIIDEEGYSHNTTITETGKRFDWKKTTAGEQGSL